MPKKIKINDIKDGMILAHPILNHFDQILLSGGAIMTEESKKVLKTWNINNIDILTDDETEVSELSDEVINIAKVKLAKRMMWQPRVRIEENLLNAAIQRLGHEIVK